uniref:Peptidylprolyl isomerase n=1 Tax=Corethron hystrix TaxID=216773 RepID=A0A7S1B7L9_9STRA|mmetsp:Transcript_15831/g.35648  ORF Transcript_15831/g.35648 Transcript_15831/m.35648 type:complete len:446 (+) Transcript_15831:40-1377(+)
MEAKSTVDNDLTIDVDRMASTDSLSEQVSKENWTDLLGKHIQLRRLSSEVKPKKSSPPQPEAQIGDVIQLRYEEIPKKKTSDPTVENKSLSEPLTIVFGQNDVPPAVEMALKFLSVDAYPTRGIVRCDLKYAWKNPGVFSQKKELSSEDRVLEYFVHIVKIVRSPNLETDIAQAVQVAYSKKRSGNSCYRSGMFQHAIGMYRNAAKACEVIVDNANTVDDRQKSKIKEKMEYDMIIAKAQNIYVDCHNNIALSYTHLKQFRDAIKACDLALIMDPKNSRSKLRKIKVLIGLADYNDADLMLKEMESSDEVEVKDELKRLEMLLVRERKKYSARKKELMGRMSKGLKGSQSNGWKSHIVQDSVAGDGKEVEAEHISLWDDFVIRLKNIFFGVLVCLLLCREASFIVHLMSSSLSFPKGHREAKESHLLYNDGQGDELHYDSSDYGF